MTTVQHNTSMYDVRYQTEFFQLRLCHIGSNNLCCYALFLRSMQRAIALLIIVDLHAYYQYQLLMLACMHHLQNNQRYQLARHVAKNKHVIYAMYLHNMQSEPHVEPSATKKTEFSILLLGIFNKHDCHSTHVGRHILILFTCALLCMRMRILLCYIGMYV